jgi:hypothetical protein
MVHLDGPRSLWALSWPIWVGSVSARTRFCHCHACDSRRWLPKRLHWARNSARTCSENLHLHRLFVVVDGQAPLPATPRRSGARCTWTLASSTTPCFARRPPTLCRPWNPCDLCGSSKDLVRAAPPPHKPHRVPVRRRSIPSTPPPFHPPFLTHLTQLRHRAMRPSQSLAWVQPLPAQLC